MRVGGRGWLENGSSSSSFSAPSGPSPISMSSSSSSSASSSSPLAISNTVLAFETRGLAKPLVRSFSLSLDFEVAAADLGFEGLSRVFVDLRFVVVEADGLFVEPFGRPRDFASGNWALDVGLGGLKGLGGMLAAVMPSS